MPVTEQSKHIGTTRITASGSVQLSYWAASTRKTNTTASAKKYMARVAGLKLQVGQLGPVVSHRTRQFLRRRSACIRSTAWPELVPGAASPVIAAAEYML